MDEDDSQDEQINRSSSHNKGKRAAVWAISDDSDDSDEETDNGESDSCDEEDEEDNVNGEEDDDADNDDDNDEEEDPKPEDGPFSGGFEGMSSDEDSEKCPICLNSFNRQPVATPENCEHYFCFDCIVEWTKNANSCPVDRISFDNIYLRKCYRGKVKKVVTVQKPVKAGQEETVNLDLEQTNCEVCGGSDREDRLLLCDGCDAGYHMECLTPPLDAVPVEEWFCPECDTNNRRTRGSAEEFSDTGSLSSTPRPATSRSQTRAVGPTRAIARTQQSERVRANVNRHRITQARTPQLAPTYLMQSTWLDETINAVVAGLNTAVYVRDLTSGPRSSHRRRTGQRRKVRRKKTSSAQGKKGVVESTGFKRRKRRVRRSKSRKKITVKKAATPRSRIANNLGIKDKKSSSLPAVYRPTEHTLSSMRADIGAASLSIYGDPFDLDPFVENEEVEEGHVTSLLEAKRRGISHSALRSHQPVARPVTTSLSRRNIEVSHSEDVVAAAPVPDLLGSILSGQSMLLMDSSDVVINRDGSLKASKPMISCTSVLCNRKNSVSEPSAGSPGFSSSLEDGSTSLCQIGNPPGPSHSSHCRLLSSSSSPSPPSVPSFGTNNTHPLAHFDLASRGLRPHPNGVTVSSHQRESNGLKSSREQTQTAPPQPQSKKTLVKPMWVDVSVLPRIPKIKRESTNLTTDSSTQGSSKGNGSTGASNNLGWLETGMNKLSGDKGRQQSVDQKKSHGDDQAQRNRPSSSSSSFSNSFSSSSSSGTSSSQAQHASFSSSTAVSFRINSSRSAWQSRRLSATSSSSSSTNNHDQSKEKEEEAKKKRLHKDKQILLSSRPTISTENDAIYDPFNPTLSDSSSSDDEAEPSRSYLRLQNVSCEGNANVLGSKNSVKRKDVEKVKTEVQVTEVSQGNLETCMQNVSQERRPSVDCLKVKQESDLISIKTETHEKTSTERSEDMEHKTQGRKVQSDLEIKCEKSCESPSDHLTGHQSKAKIKVEKESGACVGSGRPHSLDSNSTEKQEIVNEKLQSESASRFDTPSAELCPQKKSSRDLNEDKSSNSETDQNRTSNSLALDGTLKKKERDKERSSKRSRSRERRRTYSSDGSHSSSPDRRQRRRQRSRSRSKDKARRQRSRSHSDSSSRERSKRKSHTQKDIKERNDHRERDSEKRRNYKEKKRCQSRSKSRSKSPTKSRSEERKGGPSRTKSRSRSRDRTKDNRRQHQIPSDSSREMGTSRAKDKRRRSRSNSSEKRTEGANRSKDRRDFTPRDTNRSHERRKEESKTQRKEEAKHSKVSSQESFVVPQVKMESGDFDAEHQISAAHVQVERKEIKEEKLLPVDMFEDCSMAKPIKGEEEHVACSPVLQIKEESCEVPIIKHEPSCARVSPSPPAASPSADTACPVRCLAAESGKEDIVGAATRVKQEPPESDDDLNVDVMLDDLGLAQTEQQVCASVKEEGKDQAEVVPAVVGSKAKTQVKRVTWNIQEPEGPQPEKSPSKLALYKLKLKQEGRKQSLAVQASSQNAVAAASDPSKKSPAVPLGPNSSSAGPHSEEQYLKKLHMQERAVEEVKLAIKPFYQRRDINKDEYKEILRKAVQKVCHSKSGEINPLKVGNLIKAYVEKYKHARKHKKGADLAKAAEDTTELMQISDSP